MRTVSIIKVELLTPKSNPLLDNKKNNNNNNNNKKNKINNKIASIIAAFGLRNI